MLAAVFTVELDLIVLFGDNAVDAALGALEWPACEMVRDIEPLTTQFAAKLNHNQVLRFSFVTGIRTPHYLIAILYQIPSENGGIPSFCA